MGYSNQTKFEFRLTQIQLSLWDSGSSLEFKIDMISNLELGLVKLDTVA